MSNIKLPKEPLIRVLAEGVSTLCEKCGSTWNGKVRAFFRKITVGCDQPECELGSKPTPKGK